MSLVLVGACGTQAPTPSPSPTLTPAPPPPEGDVVGQGIVNGVNWLVTLELRGDERCFVASNPPAEPRSENCASDPLGPGVFAEVGSAGGSEIPTVVYGLVAPDVASVQVRMLEGFGVVRPVSVPHLGGDWHAFAIAFPPLYHLGTLIAFDAQGNVLETNQIFPP